MNSLSKWNATSLAEAQVPGTEFAFGAGLVDPLSALNVPLVYEEEALSYLKYTQGELSIDHLNLPSIAAHFPTSRRKCERKFIQRVKYVGTSCPISFKSEIFCFHRSKCGDYSESETFTFQQNRRCDGVRDVREFYVTVKVSPHPLGHISAQLKWSCGDKDLPSIRSPIHLYDEVLYTSTRNTE